MVHCCLCSIFYVFWHCFYWSNKVVLGICDHFLYAYLSFFICTSLLILSFWCFSYLYFTVLWFYSVCLYLWGFAVNLNLYDWTLQCFCLWFISFIHLWLQTRLLEDVSVVVDWRFRQKAVLSENCAFLLLLLEPTSLQIAQHIGLYER